MKYYSFTVTLFLTTKRGRFNTVHKRFYQDTLADALDDFKSWMSVTYPNVKFIIEGITKFPGADRIFEGPRVRYPKRARGRGFKIRR